MPLKKTKKRKKASRMHGRGQGTHGWGARKKHKKSGHRGGKGMAGSGKRADQKKTLVQKLYGNDYFGKQGIPSRGKKTEKGFEIDLRSYKILGTSEDNQPKNKLFIKAREASESAKEKIKKSGG